MIGWRIRVAHIMRSCTLGRITSSDLSTEVEILEPLFDASLRTVRNRAYFRSFAGLALSAALVMGCVLQAQESSPPQQASSALTPLSQEQIQKNPAGPCVEPPPLVHWKEYQGKFRKISGMFARKLERKTVHAPHYKPGAVLCTLEAKDKFLLFVHDTVDPVTFIDVAYSAGIDQAEKPRSHFWAGRSGLW